MKRFALSLVVMLAAVSCKSPDAATQILILVEADSVVRDRASSVRVNIQGQRAGDLSAPQTAVYGTGGLPLNFPLRVAVVPQGNDASRTLTIAVEGSDANGVFVRSDVVTGFVAGATLALRINLTSACIDSTCSATDGETCQPNGTCGPVERPVLPPLDAGMADGDTPDAGADSAVDAYVRPEGGVSDSSVPDSNVPDTFEAGCSPTGTRCSETGNELITCADGSETSEPCTCGVVGDPASAQCLPVPRNVTDLGALSFAATEDLVLTDDAIFNVDDGSIMANGETVRLGVSGGDEIYFATQLVGEGPDTVAIWVFNSVNLRANVSFMGERPAIILANNSITISPMARVDVSARRTSPGIGGERPVSGESGLPPLGGGVSAVPTASGTGAAGGAGGRTRGGSAGNDSNLGNGEPGAIRSAVDGEPLFGGASGGGTRFNIYATIGGAGGGAIQLFSRTSILIEDGAVIAAHGGGAGDGSYLSGGAGGGAGGMILLEAPDVTISGGVYANGGGGESGGYDSGEGGPGQDGQDGMVQALGGVPDGIETGHGGQGGTADASPSAGGHAGSGSTYTAGGGGGAAGFIFVASDAGLAPPGVISLDLRR